MNDVFWLSTKAPKHRSNFTHIRNSATVLLLVVFIFITGCTKSTNPSPPNPTQVDSAAFKVDNTWKCTVNGIQYKGSIDTSFTVVANTTGADTVLYCTGTSFDKRVNVNFRISINRTSWQSSMFSTIAGTALFAFDTTTADVYKASSNSGAEIVYKVDTLKYGKLKASFSGTIRNNEINGPEISVANGKFSCEFGKGNNESKFFSFKEDNTIRSGYVKSASIVSNTLILDCIPFEYNAEHKFRLLIRTGGTVKPGAYYSKDGDAGLQYYIPSIYPLYITDDAGDLSVNITSVTGNVVTGTFAGGNRDGKKITEGKFICRIKNYLPQPDLDTKWKFSFDDNYYYLYTLYGGNILNANKTQTGNRYLLTVNGESDQGLSKFKIVLSSSSSITSGVYKTGYYLEKQVDSMYFKSDQKSWNGNTTYLFSDEYSDTYCRIDTIDSKEVAGALFGKIAGVNIRKGSFKATF